MNRETIDNQIKIMKTKLFGISFGDNISVINTEDIVGAHLCSKVEACHSSAEGEFYYDADGALLSLKDRIDDIFENDGLLYIKSDELFIIIRDKKVIHLNLQWSHLDDLMEVTRDEEAIKRHFGGYREKIVTYNKHDQKQKTQYLFEYLFKLNYSNIQNRLTSVEIGQAYDWLWERIF